MNNKFKLFDCDSLKILHSRVFFSIIIGSVILKNEYVIKSMPYRTSMYLIAVALLAYIFENKQLTIHKLLGITIIIMGTLLLEY